MPPCGGHQLGAELLKSAESFKSCPRVGGIPGRCGGVWEEPVSSRAPVWGASYFELHIQPAQVVSSRAPVWGASRPYHRAWPKLSRFKSCPRVGGIGDWVDREWDPEVSSRAPVWGASFLCTPFCAASVVSSRAPVWGASSSRSAQPSGERFQVVPPCGGHQSGQIAARRRTPGFKSCPRVGGIFTPVEMSACISVSSRAPVWGASTDYRIALRAYFRFKSCPRVGGIHLRYRRSASHCRFKSCPRVGGIGFVFARGRVNLRFQVVPPCGGHRVAHRPATIEACVSSRAPVWGASLGRCKRYFDKIVSSRAPVWGASTTIIISRLQISFQVVPPCGGHPAAVEEGLAV